MQPLVTRMLDYAQSMARKGWMTGTGGGLCALDQEGQLIVFQTKTDKEFVSWADIMELKFKLGHWCSADGEQRPVTECLPIFDAIIAQSNGEVGAVIHTHSQNIVLACELAIDLDTSISNPPYSITFGPNEMLKGLGCKNGMSLRAIVLPNAETEELLIHSVVGNISPKYPFILIADHGAYVWGKTLQDAKRHAECLDYLCELEVKRAMIYAD